MHHDLNNLYASKAVTSCSRGPFGHSVVGQLTKRLQVRVVPAIQSRGPWLSGALCCHTGSSLNMASSEAVCSFRCLIFFVHRVLALRPRMGWNRQIPQFAPRICDCVPSSVPRRSCRVHMVVSSSTVVAFAFFTEARQPQVHTRRFSRGHVTRLQSSLYATARSLASPSPTRTFTTELSPIESPQTDVGYNYTVNNQLPRPDLHRQDTRPYGLRMKNMKDQRVTRCGYTNLSFSTSVKTMCIFQNFPGSILRVHRALVVVVQVRW